MVFRRSRAAAIVTEGKEEPIERKILLTHGCSVRRNDIYTHRKDNPYDRPSSSSDLYRLVVPLKCFADFFKKANCGALKLRQFGLRILFLGSEPSVLKKEPHARPLPLFSGLAGSAPLTRNDE
jgi:hypothetical protein